MRPDAATSPTLARLAARAGLVRLQDWLARPEVSSAVHGALRPAYARHGGCATVSDCTPRPTLRDTAAGVLGARLAALERAGWRVVPYDGRPVTDSAALGPLTGAKVTQLHAAGVDLALVPGPAAGRG